MADQEPLFLSLRLSVEPVGRRAASEVDDRERSLDVDAQAKVSTGDGRAPEEPDKSVSDCALPQDFRVFCDLGAFYS